MKFKAGNVKRVHIHQQNLRAGKPAVIVRLGSGRTYHFREVEVTGSLKVVQSDSPLSCGARAWIETNDLVEGTR